MRKDTFVTVNLEEVLMQVIDIARNKENLSASAYFRRLAIEDLQAKGLMPTNLLMKLA